MCAASKPILVHFLPVRAQRYCSLRPTPPMIRVREARGPRETGSPAGGALYKLTFVPSLRAVFIFTVYDQVREPDILHRFRHGDCIRRTVLSGKEGWIIVNNKVLLVYKGWLLINYKRKEK